jgi:hypothetical protein
MHRSLDKQRESRDAERREFRHANSSVPIIPVGIYRADEHKVKLLLVRPAETVAG